LWEWEGEAVVETEQRTDGSRVAGASLALAISNGFLGLHRQHYGRGAGRARTMIQGDYVACFLEDVFTPIERTLIDRGRWDQVREMRITYQDELGAEYRAVVEKHTGRKVRAFFSQVTCDPDMALEAFVLEPLPR
jgi:uncharacterized protein YbcI